MLNNLTQITHFSPDHEDLIHDVSYDFYGKRLITCSSDLKIKVFDLNEETGNWDLNDSWRAHDASVLKVSWAHPEYGQLFASCSLDRSIKFWEEQESENRKGGRRWQEKHKIPFKNSITSIKFSPNHQGLRLASISTDGVLRIFEAMDIINLSNWTLTDEFEVTNNLSTNTNNSHGENHYCFTWCHSRSLPPMLAVGCGKENVVKIFRMDLNNKWQAQEVLTGHNDLVLDVTWAPDMGRQSQLIGTACKDHYVRIFKLRQEKVKTSPGKNSSSLLQQQSFHPNAPGSADKNIQNSNIHQNSLPNNLSNSSMTSPPIRGALSNGGGIKKPSKFLVELMSAFNDHESEVWKVEFNILGTILSSSGDDGKVRLWKG
ncbi:epoxide hydrolase, soluble (sEH) [Lobulomyces angularis]|nr:epoxide hydrolase, soluble (sEH) [Lobulomyces angularis]